MWPVFISSIFLSLRYFYFCHFTPLQFDFSLFDHSAHPEENVFTDKKFPEMKGNYESVEQHGMFFG